MAKVTVPVECSKETVEIGLGLAKFVGAVKAALADGWDPVMDTTAVIKAAIQDLVPAMKGFDAVKGELAEDKMAFANAVTVSGSAIVGELVK